MKQDQSSNAVLLTQNEEKHGLKSGNTYIRITSNLNNILQYFTSTVKQALNQQLWSTSYGVN